MELWKGKRRLHLRTSQVEMKIRGIVYHIQRNEIIGLEDG